MSPGIKHRIHKKKATREFGACMSRGQWAIRLAMMFKVLPSSRQLTAKRVVSAIKVAKSKYGILWRFEKLPEFLERVAVSATGSISRRDLNSSSETQTDTIYRRHVDTEEISAFHLQCAFPRDDFLDIPFDTSRANFDFLIFGAWTNSQQILQLCPEMMSFFLFISENKYKHEVLVDGEPILFEILDTCPKVIFFEVNNHKRTKIIHGLQFTLSEARACFQVALNFQYFNCSRSQNGKISTFTILKNIYEYDWKNRFQFNSTMFTTGGKIDVVSRQNCKKSILWFWQYSSWNIQIQNIWLYNSLTVFTWDI